MLMLHLRIMKNGRSAIVWRDIWIRKHRKNSRESGEKTIELIKSGEYPAYSGNAIIGWCNANERKKYKYLTEMFLKIGYQTTEAADTRIKPFF